MHFSELPKVITTSLETVCVALSEALKECQDTASNLSSGSGSVREILKKKTK